MNTQTDFTRHRCAVNNYRAHFFFIFFDNFQETRVGHDKLAHRFDFLTIRKLLVCYFSQTARVERISRIPWWADVALCVHQGIYYII